MYLNGKKIFAAINNKRTLPIVSGGGEQPITKVYITLTQETGKEFSVRGDHWQYGIDWGDGTISYDTGSHTYENYGDYVIQIKGKIEAAVEWSEFGGGLKYGGIVTRSNASTQGRAVKKVEFDDYALGTCALAYCTGLEEVVLKGTETELPDFAFYNSGISYIPMNNKIRSIGSYAFAYCSNLRSFTIGENVKEVKSNAFYLSGDQEYKMTITIEPVANEDRDLSGAAIFQGAWIETVYLPSRISRIGSNFLVDNHGTVDVYYEGSEEDFAEIDKANNWASLSVVIHYLGE